MREIKFRFWDGTKGNECMAYTDKDGYITYSSKFQLTMEQAIAENNDTSGYHKPSFLMQYTGLKDKNGVDIFEGDIVRYATGEVWQVSWSKRLAAFIYKNDDKRLSSHEQTMDMHGVEVIGNVYDNPELLK